jgi:hypothetical protein
MLIRIASVSRGKGSALRVQAVEATSTTTRAIDRRNPRSMGALGRELRSASTIYGHLVYLAAIRTPTGPSAAG